MTIRKTFAIVFLSLFMAFPAFAQDVTYEVPTPAPEVTEVVSVPVATDAPPVVVVNNPPVTGTESNSLLLHFIIEGVLTAAVVFMAIKQGKLIPPETVDKVLVRFFELVKGVTVKTETPLDDTLVGITEEVMRKLIQQELQKQLNAVVTASKNSALVG